MGFSDFKLLTILKDYIKELINFVYSNLAKKVNFDKH